MQLNSPHVMDDIGWIRLSKWLSLGDRNTIDTFNGDTQAHLRVLLLFSLPTKEEDFRSILWRSYEISSLEVVYSVV